MILKVLQAFDRDSTVNHYATAGGADNIADVSI
jgi:hypothetical protein